MRDAAISSAPPEDIPRSDVSSAVGLVGLVGLLGWIAFCRAFPQIAAALDPDVTTGRLDGPYAALCGLVAAALPMVLWSVLIDKVHRRESTGLDWSKPAEAPHTREISFTKLTGLWATWAVIAAIYGIARWYWNGNYLFAMEVLGAAAIPMLVLSVPYILWLDRRLVDPRDGTWHFGAFLLAREPWDREKIVGHWRTWIIKGFFGAFMISILPGGFAEVVNADIATLAGEPGALALALIALLFVIDVQIGTVGYVMTMRPLDSQIRSGNPFLAGWLAALLCYPPINHGLLSAGGLLDYQANAPGWRYWLADSPMLLAIWGGWLVVLTGTYAWATVVFGLRFSNLTYRGVITHGPYRFTRHPAYVSKNLFWWSASLPFLVTAGGPVEALRNVIALILVSGIYYWRARTEEAHLWREDPKYREYHAWMGEHGIITAPLAALGKAIRRGRSQQDLHPAE
ncbi:methyltransferase family protein [Alteriqipengyuania sp. 357]